MTTLSAPLFASWGLTLKREREAAGRTVASCCDGVSVKQNRWRAFEEGSELPSKPEYHRMCLQLRRMRLFPPPAYADKVKRDDPNPAEDPIPPAPPLPLPPMQAAPKTWGEALRRERELEKMSQDEIAKLVGVTQTTVSAWEQNHTVPVRENYERLCQLFPRLRELAEPGSRDIDKPSGPLGMDLGKRNPPLPSAAQLPPPVEIPPPRVVAKLTTIERIVDLATALDGEGQWSVRFTRGGADKWSCCIFEERDITAKKTRGTPWDCASPGEAAERLLAELTSKIDAKIEKHRAEIAALERMKS